ncbi:MAG: hypothetical protein AB2L07_12965 [Thermoanaerobaculaceae bacterium]
MMCDQLVIPALMGKGLGENAGGIGQCQLNIERRRLGGPRPRVVKAALALLARDDRNVNAFASRASDLCHQGVVDCEEYADAIEKLLPRAHKSYRESMEVNIKLMRDHAIILRTPRPVLLESLRHSMRDGTPSGLPGVTEPEQAAMLALGRGMWELADDIEYAFATYRHPMSPVSASTRAQIELLRLRAEADPTPKLLAIVQSEVGRDVALHLASEIRNGRTTGVELDPSFGLALEELRRLNPPWLADKLRPLLAEYDKVVERRDAYLAEHPEARQPEVVTEPPRPKPMKYPFPAAQSLARVLGDLGERDLARKIQDGKTYWDEVHMMEQALVERGLLKPSECATIEGAEKQ